MAYFRADVALGLLLCAFPVMVHGFDAMGGYTPVSDVSSHSNLALDICELEALVADNNFERAGEVYHDGLNAAASSGDALRNLNTLAEKPSTSETWAQYSEYHNQDEKYIDTFLETALVSWENTYGVNKGSARQQVVKKGSRDVLLHLSIIDELDAALVQLKNGETDVASGAPNNWDKAWAYYYGSQDTKACGAPYNTVQDRAKDFGTQEAGSALAHKHILAAFLSGQEGIREGGAAGLETAEQARDVVVKQLRIPYMQGVLKYSNSVDSDITTDSSSDAIKHQAEAWVFFRAIAAQLHQKDSAGAAELTLRLDPANEPKEGNYLEAYCALDKVLPALDTTWDDIGRHAGTPLVDCESRTVVSPSADKGECSIDQLTEFTAKCRMVNASSVIADDEVNLPAVCGLKYDAVRCMHDEAFTVQCKLPMFGLPTMKEEESGDRRRRSLLSNVLHVQINAQLGFTVVNTLDCCSWYEVEYKVEVYSDRRRKMLTFRELLEADVCEDCHFSFCEVEDDTKATGNKWFSVPALFILYRETLEAAIIVAVLLQFMDRTGNKLLKKWVWIGSLAGVLSSIALGVIFITVYYVTRDNLFSGDAAYFFEGAVSYIATVMITVLAFCMLRMWNMQKKWELKLQKEMSSIDKTNGEDGDREDKDESHVYTIFSLSFSAVFREGVESVVFLAGIGANTEATAIPIPGVLGIALGIITGLLVFRGGDSMKTLKALFTITFVVLLVIAAGIFTYGTHEFQETGMFGAWKPMSARPWQNEYLWDISDCCSHKTNDFFALMRALVGYTATPTFVEAAAYLLYWAFVVSMFVFRYKMGTLVDKDLSKYEEETNPNPMYEISPKEEFAPIDTRESEDTCSDDSKEVIEGKGGETLKAAL